MPAHVQLTIISRATLSFAAPGIVEASGRYAFAILAAFGPASITQLFEGTSVRNRGSGGPIAPHGDILGRDAYHLALSCGGILRDRGLAIHRRIDLSAGKMAQPFLLDCRV